METYRDCIFYRFVFKDDKSWRDAFPKVDRCKDCPINKDNKRNETMEKFSARRLTVYYLSQFDLFGVVPYQEVDPLIKRLLEYEKTDLTPQQVMELVANSVKLTQYDEAKKKNEELKKLCSEAYPIIQRLAEYESTDLTPQQVKDMIVDYENVKCLREQISKLEEECKELKNKLHAKTLEIGSLKSIAEEHRKKAEDLENYINRELCDFFFGEN